MLTVLDIYKYINMFSYSSLNLNEELINLMVV